MKKSTSRFLVCAAAVLCSAFGSCSKDDSKGTETFKVFSETYENTIEISGNISAADTQLIEASSDGTIQKVYFKEGDRVKKGDVICKMDDLEQQYNIANLKYQLAQKKLSASPREIELLEMQLKVKQQELENKKYVARFDGIIAKLNVSEGDYVEAKNDLATIINREYLKATVEIAETDVSKLELNQKVVFTFPAYEETLEGYVSYFPAIGTITSRGSTVVEADVRIDNPPEEIYTGFSFTGTIQITEPQTVLLTDKKALFFENKKPCVKVLDRDGNITTVNIEYELYGDNYIKILSGVKSGDLLMASGTTERSGQKKDDFSSSAKKDNSNKNNEAGFGGMMGGGMPQSGGMPPR